MFDFLIHEVIVLSGTFLLGTQRGMTGGSLQTDKRGSDTLPGGIEVRDLMNDLMNTTLEQYSQECRRLENCKLLSYPP